MEWDPNKREWDPRKMIDYRVTTVGEGSLGEGERRSLQLLRRHIRERACRYCGHTGTLTLEGPIYEHYSVVTYADGQTERKHTCFKIHARCSSSHNKNYDYGKDTHINCFYISPMGFIGCADLCYSDGCKP